MARAPTTVHLVEHRVPGAASTVMHAASTFELAVGYCRAEHDELETGDSYTILCMVVDADYCGVGGAAVAHYDRTRGLDDIRDAVAANGYVV